MTAPISARGRTPSDERPLIVVLGASGPIGAAVTEALAARPVRLRAVARRRPAVPANSGLEAEIDTWSADLTDSALLADAVRGATAVINLVKHDGGWRVAEHDATSERTNTGVMKGLLTCLEEAPAPGPPPIVIFSGTVSQLGIPDSRPITGSEPDVPVTAYDHQKLAAEQLLKKATDQGLVRGISLRLPTVFGQGRGARSDDPGVVSVMARRALAGQELPMWHDGTVLRELVHVSDVAAAVCSALDHPDALAGGHWLLGSDRSVPLGQVLSLVAQVAAAITHTVPVPLITVAPPQDAPVIDFTDVTIDSSPFRKTTGWRPLMPLRTAIERTVATQAAA